MSSAGTTPAFTSREQGLGGAPAPTRNKPPNRKAAAPTATTAPSAPMNTARVIGGGTRLPALVYVSVPGADAHALRPSSGAAPGGGATGEIPCPPADVRRSHRAGRVPA